MGNVPTTLSLSSPDAGMFCLPSHTDVSRKIFFSKRPQYWLISDHFLHVRYLSLNPRPEAIQVLESGLPRFYALFCKFFSHQASIPISTQSAKTDWVSDPPRHLLVFIGLAIVSNKDCTLTLCDSRNQVSTLIVSGNPQSPWCISGDVSAFRALALIACLRALTHFGGGSYILHRLSS